jgi:hypothetical protein
MYQAAGEPDRGARPLPELPEVADRLPVAVEDVRAVEPSRRDTVIEYRGEFPDKREYAAALVLAVLRAEPDGLIVPVIVPPLQGADFADAPGGEGEMSRRRRDQGRGACRAPPPPHG